MLQVEVEKQIKAEAQVLPSRHGVTHMLAVCCHFQTDPRAKYWTFASSCRDRARRAGDNYLLVSKPRSPLSNSTPRNFFICFQKRKWGERRKPSRNLQDKHLRYLLLLNCTQQLSKYGRRFSSRRNDFYSPWTVEGILIITKNPNKLGRVLPFLAPTKLGGCKQTWEYQMKCLLGCWGSSMHSRL